MTANLPDVETLRLIALVKQGDEIALGQLLDRHRDDLRRYAERGLGKDLAARIDASDVVQQTFLSVCRKVEHFDGESLPEFIAWIYQIHQHNIQDVAREHTQVAKRDIKREQSADLERVADGHDESTPSRKAIRNEEHSQLEHLIQLLPEDQRNAIRLRHIEGKTLVEIAEVFGRSTQAVASLLKRGLENLRKVKPLD